MRLMRILVTTSALFAAGCGSPASPSSAAGPQSVTGSVAALAAASHDVTVAKAGTASVVLTWTAATVDLDLYVTSSACSTYPKTTTLPACALLASSTNPSGAREELTLAVTKSQPLRIWVDNFSGASSSYTVDVTVR